MTKYDINPAGVKKVLTATEHDAEEFATLLKPLGGAVKAAGSGCGGSGAIIPALNGFFEVQDKRLEALGQRVNACLTGAAAATTAYVHGDEEMVATYQTNASRARISKIPK
ncbi:DUF6507 family protein [uncultured Friedmanniella sp.]|uniref:DUF6507 family protein n=1 Tax=uncultured Friedmanniella sp. TaxID=335381 RepID=UPI0035CC65C7